MSAESYTDVHVIRFGINAMNKVEEEQLECLTLRSLECTLHSGRKRIRKPTVLLVTHKLGVCDWIVVLRKKHRMVEDGGFEALMERRGEFAR